MAGPAVQCRGHPRDDTIDYLRRWRLLDTRWGRVYLHHFIEFDDAAEPLD